MGQRKKSQKSSQWLVGAGIFGLVCATFLLIILQFSPTRMHMGWTPLLFSVWGGVVVVLCSRKAAVQSNVWLPILLGLILRCLFIGQSPLLSDDLFRYLWEGLVTNAGHNPLIQSPNDLMQLDPELHSLVNHPQIASIYPPLAITWFRLMNALGGHFQIAQTLSVLADLFIMIGLGRILLDKRQHLWPLWVYALHPLPIIENAWSAHIDTLALALAVWGLWAWNRKYYAIGVGLTTLGVGTKLFPILWLPAMFFRIRTPHIWAGLGLSLMVILWSAWPLLTTDIAALNAWGIFGKHWEFNGFAYPWLSVLFGSTTRPILLAIAALACGTIYWRAQTITDLWFGLALVFVLTTPTLHPWYALWLLIPSILTQRTGTMMACVFVLNGYAVLLGLSSDGEWIAPAWLWWATWIPFLIATSFDTPLWRSEDPT